MSSAREIDENGYMTVKGCPISSFGIFDYSAGQIGLPGDPNRIVKVYRPESAVSDPAALASFKDMPFIIDHEMLSGFEGDEGATAPEDYGFDGWMTSNVYYEQPWMRADLRIISRKAQAELDPDNPAGRKDLSLGYSCEFEMKPGVWDGQPYEVIQTNMRGNHIALVGEGRVPGARVLDGRVFDHLNFDVRPSIGTTNMAKKINGKGLDSNAVEQLKALIPALHKFLQEESQEPEHQDGGAAGDPAGETPPAHAGGEAGGGSTPGGEVDGGAVPPAESGEGGAGDEPGNAEQGLAVLIKQAQELLAKLEAQVSGQAGDEGGEEGGEGGDPVQDMSQIGADGEGGEGGEEGNGKASPGPSAGTHAMAGDAAVRSFYADLARKDRIYNRLSKVVGAFDHSGMGAREVAAYGVKKLGLACAKGAEFTALDMYLTGREAGNKVNPAKQRAADASEGAAKSLVDNYIKGGK